MTVEEQLEFVRQSCTREDRLCQLAEECAELSQAALKLRRAIWDTNPTPVTTERANDMVEEETLDVCLCLAALDLATLGDMAGHPRLKAKLARWVERLEEAKND